MFLFFLSLSLFLQVSTFFTLTPHLFPLAISIIFFCRKIWNFGNMMLSGMYFGKEKHVCLSRPLKDCLIMSCSWLEYSMALGLRNLWQQNIFNHLFPKMGRCCLFTTNVGSANWARCTIGVRTLCIMWLPPANW